jgi:chromosome segregation ATPase
MEMSILGLMTKIDELGEKLRRKNLELHDLQQIIQDQEKKIERLEARLNELQSL